MYAVLATSPASEYVVLAVFETGVAALETNVDHVVPPLVDLSIL